MRSSWLKMATITWAIILVYNCKEDKKVVKEEAEIAVTDIKAVPKIIEDLAQFAEISFSDPNELDKLLHFKVADRNGAVRNTNMDEVAQICKQSMTTRQISNFPIIELVNSSKVILIVQGKGFSGPIWGKLLLNSENMQFDKIEFQHSAEAEGYGAAMTFNSFESQFTGSDISQDSFTYTLNQDKSKIRSGDQIIDGISGATQTSSAVVKMMNDGLSNYSSYLAEIKKKNL